MADFREMYLKLFRSQVKAIDILKAAQVETEDMYIEVDEPDLKLFPADQRKIHQRINKPTTEPEIRLIV